jgi:trk system potassium uptake protein TrkH
MTVLKTKQLDLHLIAYANGLLLMILASALGIIGMLTKLSQGFFDVAFVDAAFVTAFFGGALVLSNRTRRRPRISIHTGYLLTFSCWVVLSLFASMPLYFSALGLSYTDAIFETVSALTTTGSTVLTGLDNMPHDLLLWRSFLQWLGGIGVVVVAMAILPMLRVGGMNLFKSESSDISGKVVGRMDYFVKLSICVYAFLTSVCAILYHLAGMNWFDALNHAMTTISTGGFSTHDASMGYFNSFWIEMVGTSFMLIGAMPLVMYAHFFIVHHGDRTKRRYDQVQGLFAIYATAVFLLSVWNWAHNDMAFFMSVRQSMFNAASMLTGTGFASADFSQWGSFALGVMFILYFIGGCAGSTAGSIKIFRWQILMKGLNLQFLRNVYPNTVVTMRYGGRVVDDRTMHSVRNFLFLFLLSFAFFSLVLMAYGIDFLGATSAVAQALSNAGPALTPELGPNGNFANVPDGVKWVLGLVMITGRLELFTVYALIVPSFWKF